MTHKNIIEHYEHGDLLRAITAGISQLGKTPDSVTIDDLAAIDEYHIGGRQASLDLLEQLQWSTAHHILDIGCGLGGTARLVADRYNSRVTGIDLTAEYVETGRALCHWTGNADRIVLYQGSALFMPFEDTAFDGACMLHVGMNIRDKAGLFAEVFRVLRIGAMFGVYDVMRIGDGELRFPVPWAANPEASVVATPGQYREALQEAGFSIIKVRNRHEFAVDFFRQVDRAAAEKEKPPLGPHVLMGPDAPAKARNMIENISAGRLAPVEIIAGKV